MYLYLLIFQKLARLLQYSFCNQMVRKFYDLHSTKFKKEFKMTLSNRTHFASLFAAAFCAFVTIGTSIAPAVAPIAPYFA